MAATLETQKRIWRSIVRVYSVKMQVMARLIKEEIWRLEKTNKQRILGICF